VTEEIFLLPSKEKFAADNDDDDDDDYDDDGDDSFIHSFIHSAISIAFLQVHYLLLRGAPDYSTDAVSEFHAEAHRQQ